MICAVCLDALEENGNLGYEHHDTGSTFGADGHAAVPIHAGNLKTGRIGAIVAARRRE
jgi:hypothetical protein